MSQYMLLIYDDPSVWQTMGEDEQKAVMGEYFTYTNELREAGAFVAGDALQPTATATSVRLRDGGVQTTDGPFAETKEVLGGYYLIEVDSDEEAQEWASKIPSARFGTIEVRPVMVYSEATTA